MRSFNPIVSVLLWGGSFAFAAFLPSQRITGIRCTSVGISSYAKQQQLLEMKSSILFAGSQDELDGVVELADDEDENKVATESPVVSAPFLSQGEILEESLQFSNDPKQTRVIGYIVVSLIPVLFLIPLMLGSRDLIPLEALPPVEL